jgi:hypothetical protein
MPWQQWSTDWLCAAWLPLDADADADAELLLLLLMMIG